MIARDGATTLVVEDKNSINATEVASPKGYKKTKVGVIPEEWSVVTFNDLRDTNVSHSITGGPFGSNLKSEHYTKAGVRIIQLQNIGDGSFINKDFIYTNEKKATELKSCLIYPNDIILAKMAEPVARACIIPNFEKKFLMGSDGIRLHIDKDKYDNKFILESINYKQFRRIAIARSTGSTRQRIGLNDLKTIPIAIPPLKEQQKIANILTTWDKAIEKMQKLITAKEKLKKGLMQKLLSGEVRFGATTLVVENKNSINATEVASPEWEEVKLKKIVNCFDNKRVPLNKQERQKMQGNIPYYGSTSIVDYINDYIFNEELVLVSEDGGYFYEFETRPIAFYITGKSWINNHVHIIKNKNDSLNLKFLYYALVHKNITAFLNGGTRAKLNKKDLLLLKIKLPPLKEQQKIAQVLTTADKEIELLKKELEELKKQKKGLMQKLLSGEVRVTYEP